MKFLLHQLNKVYQIYESRYNDDAENMRGGILLQSSTLFCRQDFQDLLDTVSEEPGKN